MTIIIICYSLLESEVKHIEEVFSAARAGDVDASRQVSFSLLQKKTSKVVFNFLLFTFYTAFSTGFQLN